MTVPVIIDGEERGRLCISREGAYTRFEARCAFVPGVRRLWAFGGGRRGLLGVMLPAGGELRLCRRLSRAALRDFPERIEYAGFDERAAPVPPREERAEAEGEAITVTEDGARYLALPCALRREVPGLRLREIGGRRYLLFRC